jgi:hypothetical protein
MLYTCRFSEYEGIIAALGNQTAIAHFEYDFVPYALPGNEVVFQFVAVVFSYVHKSGSPGYRYIWSAPIPDGYVGKRQRDACALWTKFIRIQHDRLIPMAKPETAIVLSIGG